MHEDKLVSDQAFDQADAEFKMKAAAVESARKRVAQLQAQLDSTRDDLHKTTVVSPMDGVVTSLPKEEGEIVIGAQSFSPTVIMTVADLSVMECEIMVDETDIRNLKLGQAAEVRVDALEGIKIKGEVTEIGASAIVRGRRSRRRRRPPSGNTANQAKDFKVTVTLKDPPAEPAPGAQRHRRHHHRPARQVSSPCRSRRWWCARSTRRARSWTPTRPSSPGQRRGTPSCRPAKAKGEEKEGVFVVEKDKAVFRPVKTGIIGETDIEILEGVGGRGDRHRLLQDPAHPQGRGPVKIETEEEEVMSAEPARSGPTATDHPRARTSGAPTRWARRRSTPCAG